MNDARRFSIMGFVCVNLRDGQDEHEVTITLNFDHQNPYILSINRSVPSLRKCLPGAPVILNSKECAAMRSHNLHHNLTNLYLN